MSTLENHSTGKIGTVVPMHDELKPGTLKSILKLAGVKPDEFAEFL
jgi:predicted RNA binding protein YcfA (HicA-like mRNA interferase family)